MTQFKSTGKGNDRKVFPVGQSARKRPIGISRDISGSNNMATNGKIPSVDLKQIDKLMELKKKFGMSYPTIYEKGNNALAITMDEARNTTAWIKLKELPDKVAINTFNGGYNGYQLSPLIDYPAKGKYASAVADFSPDDRKKLKTMVNSIVKELSETTSTLDVYHHPRDFGVYDFYISLLKPVNGNTGYITVTPAVPENIKGWTNGNKYGKTMSVKMEGVKGFYSMYSAKWFLDMMDMYDHINASSDSKKPSSKHYYAAFQDYYPITVSTMNPIGKRLTTLPSAMSLANIRRDPSKMRYVKNVIEEKTGAPIQA